MAGRENSIGDVQDIILIPKSKIHENDSLNCKIMSKRLKCNSWLMLLPLYGLFHTVNHPIQGIHPAVNILSLLIQIVSICGVLSLTL